MKLKNLIKYLTPHKLDITANNLEVKVFDRNKECIGDITNITIEKHADKTYVMINVKLEDLK